MAGLMTIRGSGHERWRTYAVGVVVGAFILEGYTLTTTPLRIPRNGMNVFMVSLQFLLLCARSGRVPVLAFQWRGKDHCVQGGVFSSCYP